MRKRRILEVDVPSTDFIEEAYWDGRGAAPALRYSFADRGSIVSSGIQFASVKALRKRSENLCTAWHIDEVYDALVEIEDSEWMAELRADADGYPEFLDGMHHYMIYLDSVGCFEVVAGGARAIRPVPATVAVIPM
ncbi:MAG TPA: hypothetical protein VNA88_04200 [Candidatus Kapabacteria bacterium]|jgi:hypothetical protein|nr:hypothetical protein [Candidatus Kapabacteria bacterium]HVK37710.1 hypothetical protein [Candidatus Kapabacteria bacterium]